MAMTTLRRTISPSWVTAGRPLPTSVPASAASAGSDRAAAEAVTFSPSATVDVAPTEQPASADVSSSTAPSRSARLISGPGWELLSVHRRVGAHRGRVQNRPVRRDGVVVVGVAHGELH